RREEALKEGMKAVALRMLEAGKYALEEIVTISGLPLDEVKNLHHKPEKKSVSGCKLFILQSLA
uniref:hypothetical protein n=1 Tax=uncultured Escherichia sp. TaxID=237777 RepID=UPI0025B6719C